MNCTQILLYHNVTILAKPHIKGDLFSQLAILVGSSFFFMNFFPTELIDVQGFTPLHLILTR